MKIREQLSLAPAVLAIAYIVIVIVIIWKITLVIQISQITQLLERQNVAFHQLGRGLSEVVLTNGTPDSIQIIKDGIDKIFLVHNELHEHALWNEIDEVDVIDSILWSTILTNLQYFLRENDVNADDATLRLQGKLLHDLDVMYLVENSFVDNFNALSTLHVREMYIYIAVGLALIIFSFLGFFVFLSKHISKPLNRLHDIASVLIDWNGELAINRLDDAKLKIDSMFKDQRALRMDEIRDLARSIVVFMSSTIRYIDDIARSELQLKETNEGLEQTVQTRTQEVQKYNRVLEEEIEYHKDIERRLEQAAKDVYLSSQAKSRFVANVSHEIRTPLNGIIGMLSLLEDFPMTDEQKNYVMVAKKSADNLLALINDVLDFSRLEAKKVQLEETDFSVRDLINDVVEAFSSNASSKNITIRKSICKSIPTVVKGYPVQLRQILNNLVGNAIKFTEHGTVEVAAQCIEHDARIHRIRFVVSDTGVGIAQDAMVNLFKPFTQADASITRKFGGTGLGLVLVKQLAELMRGHVDVESELGKGTTISVILTVERSSSKGLAQSSRFVLDNKSFVGKRVLVVEDNTVNQMVAVKFLNKFGVDIQLAENGEDAINKLEEQTYDIIFMDCHMPVLDGYEATRRIRKGERQPAIPIIAMTADAVDNAMDRCVESGMNDYISKPFTLEQLQGMLKKWLRVDESTKQFG